jgi:hypothetical protein
MVMRLNSEELIMIARLISLVLVFFSATVLAAADDAFMLTPKEKSKSNGYWITDQGYWVSCGLRNRNSDRRVDESDPGVFFFRLGLVHGGRLHPGPFGVGGQDLKIIGPMWLVIREGDDVILRVPMKTEVDPGNEVHLLVQFNAEAEIVSKLQIEFEERLQSESRRIRVPLSAFLSK